MLTTLSAVLLCFNYSTLRSKSNYVFLKEL
nr:MAG TPA: hypothetical protein [Caudoviricetes sp.]